MSSIRTGVGLFSGIDIAGITAQLIAAQRAPARRLESRLQSFKAVQGGVQALEANVLALSTAVSQLNTASVFNATRVSVSDPSQLSVSTTSQAALGTYAFQVLNLATAEQRLSKGFANSDEQTLGTGTISISRGGELATSTRLDVFNGGEGVRRGSIRITDRSGQSATIDLSKAYSIDDVLSAINDQSEVSVTAHIEAGHLVLVDTSGSTTSNLSVQDIGSGKTALDLGLRQSVASSTLTGDEVYYLTGDFTFDQINDGNGVFNAVNAPDLRITLQDSTQLDINLDGVFNLDELLSAINTHTSNGGKLTAALSGGRLVLTDNTGGVGSLSVTDINGAAVVSALGLDNAASGNVLTGDRLLAGIGSRLLRNLRGGQGVTTTGQISVTDRTGRSATINLTGAESLDEVVNAINAAQDGGIDLTVTARVNSLGTGIEIVDNSGSTASNLIIADIGGSTLAEDLGIEVNAAVDRVNSGALNLRRVNHATALETYAPDGGSVETGSFLIIDSAGNQESVSISSSVRTIGDVIQRINATTSVQVRAELNSTGDGFVIIDESGGAGQFQIQEITGSTAADLRIGGTGVIGGGGQPEINSRQRTTISVTSTDTLETLAAKINQNSHEIGAAIINDGSAFNAFRLALTSDATGSAGKLIVDSGELDLGLEVTTAAQDALLQVGANASTSFLVASETNIFTDVAPGVSVTANAPGAAAAQVEIERNTDNVKNTLRSLITAYNAFIDRSADLTKFDPDPTKRGVLQGQGVVIRVQTRLSSLLTKTYFGTDRELQTLSDLGVRVTTGGRLEFDESVFDAIAADDPNAIRDFFLDSTSGAARKFDEALDSLTDIVDGVFKIEKTSLQSSIDSLQSRIEQIDSLLAIRQERLLRQFLQMESVIGELQSQQNAITALSLAASSSNQ